MMNRNGYRQRNLWIEPARLMAYFSRQNAAQRRQRAGRYSKGGAGIDYPGASPIGAAT
jgi:hypothetical protein